MVGVSNFIRALVAIFLCLMCSGCLRVERSFEAVVAVPGGFSASGEAVVPPRWWLSFADPELERLMDRALAGNLSLLAARERLEQAAAVATKAGAERIPSLNFETSAARTWLDTPGARETRNTFSAGLYASYELDLWGRVRAGREAASYDFLARAEDLKTAGITLSAQVTDTWYRWLEQQGLQTLYAEQLETNQKILELVTLQFRTGQVGIGDVLQQRQLVEAGHGELALVAARVMVLEHQLDILAGEAPGSQPAAPTTEPVVLPPLPLTGVPAELLQRRPDVRSAWFRLQAADQRVAVAVAERFPKIGLSGRLETTAGQADALFQDWLSSLAANLVGPLLDGGRRRAEVERTRAVAAETLHDYGQTVLVALAEVEDALVNERQQGEHLASLERQLELAVQAEASLRGRYLQGAVDYQRVLTARLSTQGLQRKLLTARRELLGFRVDLCRALAGGWDVASLK